MKDIFWKNSRCRRWVLIAMLISIALVLPFSPLSHSEEVVINGWELRESGTTEDIYGVSLVDTETGFIVGGSWDTFEGFILRTTDGGETWTSPVWGILPDQPDQPTPPPHLLFDVSFANHDVGMAVGWEGKIYYTRDGGEQWDLRQPNYMFAYYGAHMIDADWGYAVGICPFYYQCLITRTTNCWNSSNNFIFKFEIPGQLWDISKVSDVHFIDHYHGCATVDAGYYRGGILYTFNGGWIWRTVYFDKTASLNALDFPTPNVGYAVGNFGLILKTIDGGITWGKIHDSAFTDINFLDVSFLTKDLGTIVGEQGVIMRTTDGGRTWCVQESGVTTNLNAVEFLDPNTGWVVGDHGVLLRTRSGGFPISLLSHDG